MAEPLFEVDPSAGGVPPGRVRLPFDVGDPRLAAAAWSRLAEPGDAVAGALVAHLGASAALGWLDGAVRDPARMLHGAALAGLGTSLAASLVTDAVARWAPRLERLDPRRELRVLERCGGALLLPGDPGWPAALGDLGLAAPFALWVRGRADLDTVTARSAAVVGARAASTYGEHVAGELGGGLAERGWTVVSGGAYGIDAAAHRGALADGATVAVLAGGVDRLYPRGNDALLRRLADGDGALVSEVPPGSAPFRQRFLARNRIIAALTGATVVVEAAWRSGALSTARHATELLRPLGAVPGPVTAATSTGCHRLLREGAAVCVTDAAEVVELAGCLDGAAREARPAAAGTAVSARSARDAARDRAAGLGDPARSVWDALPARGRATVESVARTAALSARDALAGLGALEQHDLAEQAGGRWRRTS